MALETRDDFCRLVFLKDFLMGFLARSGESFLFLEGDSLQYHY